MSRSDFRRLTQLIRSVCRPSLLLFLLWVTALTPSESFAQAEPEEDVEPVLLSVFPLTGQRGTLVKAEVRGSRLDGAYALWFDHSGFKGRILSVEEVKDQVKQKVNPLEKPKKSSPLYRALIEFQIEPAVSTGVYRLRLVSQRGVSNPNGFSVVDVPVTIETGGSHQTIDQCQLAALPGFISGKIGEPGQVDYFSFRAKKGQALRFEAVDGQKFNGGVASSKFAPEVALYHGGGSWLDSNRLTRLLFEEERSSDLMHLDAQGTYKFLEDGEYFLQVSGLFGQGCPDCTYQVGVFSHERPSAGMARAEYIKSEWSERSLSRNLADNWMEQLEARSVKKDESAAPAKEVPSSRTSPTASTAEQESKQKRSAASRPLTIVEREPNEGASQAESISVPAVVEGTIEHPGDLDSFRFKVDPGQKLTFEVETPDASTPYFNPRIGVVDSQDRELFSNVERRLSMFNNNADPQVYLKGVKPKAFYSFERGGEYVLQVRDITSRYGNSGYRYRILVRPEIPHVGEISVMARDGSEGANSEGAKGGEINHINLVRGEPKKLILVASYEEGFTGDLSFTFTGLPEGVQAFPAVQFSEGRAPLEVTQNPDIIAPKQQKTAIVVLARPDAQLTAEPSIVQLRCQPIAKGRLGPNLLVREIPLMVVEGSAPPEREKPQSEK